MQQHFEHRFSASVARVIAMYADENFCARRAEATGALSSDVVIDGEVDGPFTVAIRRVMPTSDIQADLRGFLGETLAVRYTEVWEGPEDASSREGTFAVEIVGAPARAAGTVSIIDDGDGSVMTIDSTVTASVPFLQQLVVAAVSDALERGLAAELEAADAWLATA